uniref:Uncharacterized protein n=1 Tax=Magallana gigas TaxID=29159 RepID=K1PGL0_MAGGI
MKYLWIFAVAPMLVLSTEATLKPIKTNVDGMLTRGLQALTVTWQSFTSQNPSRRPL